MFKRKSGALNKFCEIVLLRLGIVKPEEVSKTMKTAVLGKSENLP
jgi:hypothetical protein